MMGTTEVFEAPVLDGFPPASDKWSREFEAFRRLLPELLKTHRQQFVAVHEGRVVGAGPDKLTVARTAYREFGPVEILVRLVTDSPPRIVRIVSPRIAAPEGI